MKKLLALYMLAFTLACSESRPAPCFVLWGNDYTVYRSGEAAYRIPTLKAERDENGYIWQQQTKTTIARLSCEIAAVIGERIYEFDPPVKHSREVLAGWKVRVCDTNRCWTEISTVPRPNTGPHITISKPSSQEVISIPVDSSKPIYILPREIK